MCQQSSYPMADSKQRAGVPEQDELQVIDQLPPARPYLLLACYCSVVSLAGPCLQHTSLFGLISHPNQNAVICYCHLLAKASRLRTFLHGSRRERSSCMYCHFTSANLSHGLGRLGSLQGHLQREMAQCLAVLEELQICRLHGIVVLFLTLPLCSVKKQWNR